MGNRSSHVVKKPTQAKPPVSPIIDVAELTEAERELEASSEDDIEVEQIKAKELKK